MSRFPRLLLVIGRLARSWIVTDLIEQEPMP